MFLKLFKAFKTLVFFVLIFSFVFILSKPIIAAEEAAVQENDVAGEKDTSVDSKNNIIKQIKDEYKNNNDKKTEDVSSKSILTEGGDPEFNESRKL